MTANTIRISFTIGTRAIVVDYDGKTWTETSIVDAIRSAVDAGADLDFTLSLNAGAAKALVECL